MSCTFCPAATSSIIASVTAFSASVASFPVTFGWSCDSRFAMRSLRSKQRRLSQFWKRTAELRSQEAASFPCAHLSIIEVCYYTMQDTPHILLCQWFWCSPRRDVSRGSAAPAAQPMRCRRRCVEHGRGHDSAQCGYERPTQHALHGRLGRPRLIFELFTGERVSASTPHPVSAAVRCRIPSFSHMRCRYMWPHSLVKGT